MSDLSPPSDFPAPLPPALPSARTNRLSEDSPLYRVLEIVDRIVAAGRSRTEGVQRAARVARRLPAILFGITLALAGVLLLALGALRGAVEVTAAIFPRPHPWVAWLVFGGMLLFAAVFLGTIRNRGERTRDA